MGDFTCPKCHQRHSKTPYAIHRICYTRCSNCKIGIELRSSLFKQDLEVISTYVPDGSVVSPKTGNTLDSARINKAPRGAMKFIAKLQMPSLKKRFRRRRRREGSLKEDCSSIFAA